MALDLTGLTAQIVHDLYGVNETPNFTRPDSSHGDYATNIALQLAKKVQKNPREVAQAIAEELESRGQVATDVAGPGFINIRLSDAVLFESALNATDLPQPLKDKVVVAEYSDPNPFKALHAGHLYTSLFGDAVAKIVETAGAKVYRVNFGGDVGLHVAKAMWAITQELGGEYPEKLSDVSGGSKLEWVSQRYVVGNEAYETNEQAKQEIIEINKRVYTLHTGNDRESGFAQIYWTCREWSYEGFDDLYQRLNMIPFDKYYPESETTSLGVESVKKGVESGVFKESDGAIVYDGESKGLHTRVFINSVGLPTYEAKDLGLSLTKWQDYQFDLSLIITGNDIKEYMKVIISAVSNFNPEAAERTVHIMNGMLKLAGGVKMSSRKGNTLLADDILAAAYDAAKTKDSDIVLGAVRYSFLKTRAGGDIIYQPEESVSTDGNSGPYLQYALVRARSIIRKLESTEGVNEVSDLDELERSLARQISLYPEEFEASLKEYSPHHICNYLFDLAVTFNRFYEGSRVIGHERAPIRANLVQAYEKTLAHGLTILGMPQPEQM